MKVLTKNVIYHGREEPLPQRVALQAGPVSLFYEDGNLRYLRLGSREIIRRIYVAVRDQNWGSVPAKLSNVDVVNRPDSFRLAGRSLISTLASPRTQVGIHTFYLEGLDRWRTFGSDCLYDGRPCALHIPEEPNRLLRAPSNGMRGRPSSRPASK